ncbi:LOW QUALITY PROTEIN: hypothetical protein HID58_009563, partial [Brassica napus]
NYCLYRLRDETDEEHLGKLKSQIKGKESEIHSLKKKLDCLVAENRKLEERIMSVSSLEFTFRAASRSVHDFAKSLISLMKATVETIFGNVTYAKNSDKKVDFESYIVRRMFHGMKLNPCDVTKLMSFDDPLDTLTAFPDSAKYLLLVHPSMEASFFGNLDMRGLVLLASKNLVLSNLCESGQVIMGSWIASRFLGSESKDLWWSEEELVSNEHEEGDLSVEFVHNA